MGNPDVSYYKLRIDSFGPDGEEGIAPSCDELEVSIESMLRGTISPAQKLKGVTYNVEVGMVEG